jgi:dipeptidyl aminopeptidase/acylaminoacyl peptidase
VRPEDLVQLRVVTDPRLSPDGHQVAFTVQTVAPRQDGYRHAVWMVASDGSSPARRLTIGSRHDRHPRFSPDGQSLAFLSDRRLQVEEEPDAPRNEKDREDGTQVHLLPLGGGEARRLTDLPRGVDDFAWSPDGRQLVVLTASAGSTRAEDARRRGKAAKRKRTDPPESDYHYIDRLNYMVNGEGFTYDRVAHLWLVDVDSGASRRLTAGLAPDSSPAWSPDGSRIAYATNGRRDHDLAFRSDIRVVDVATGRTTEVTGGRDGFFFAPAWLPDGSTLAALGGRFPADVYRARIWLFAADGSDAASGGGRDLTGPSDLMPAASMGSDLQPGEEARIIASGDGRWLYFTAPIDGSYELWRVAIDGHGRPERLTDDRHYISGWDAVAAGNSDRVAYVRSSPTECGEVHLLDAEDRPPRRLTGLNDALLAQVELRLPEEVRYHVDGREIQAWLVPAGDGRQPLVTEIHGGPHTLWGWSPFWEFQLLAASGISVFYCNPRGSEGYGKTFNEANLGDWGAGPMRDVIAGIDHLVARGLADPDRLGVTGGSYGGYLTTWIVGHDARFRAAITCRSVADMGMLFMTGDISGGEWARIEMGRTPWQDPEFYREVSPITYANRIRTPLLIQHSERDLRTTVGQAEALFTALRSHRRPVRMMRVPDENHELTRSGTPFRRIENLVQVRDWFVHYLVRGRRGLPPLPKVRAGR